MAWGRWTSMPRQHYLTDLGIRQAVEQGLLLFDPPLDPAQIQPASVDIRAQEIDDLFSLEHYLGHADEARLREAWLNREIAIPAYSEAIILATQRMAAAKSLRFRTELRSSMRRLAAYTPSGATMHLQKLAVEVHNPGPIDISLSPGDKMAQLLFMFSEDDLEYSCYKAGLAGFSDYGEEARRHEQVLALDHGYALQTNWEVIRALKEGYFQVTPKAKLEKGLLCVHAGKTARVLRTGVRVRLGQKSSIDEAFETVSLPYTRKPGEYVDVETKESFALSPHIAIQFYDYLGGTSNGFTLLGKTPEEQRQVMRDIGLSSTPSGWVDPGYRGSFSRQPKSFRDGGFTIHEGDLLGHGVVILYPQGVQRKYGDAGLGSHYQDQKTTQFLENMPS